MKRFFNFIFLISYFIFSCFAQQSKIDSLEKSLNTLPKDTNKVKCLYQLCREYENINPEKAELYGEQALSLAKQLNYESAISQSLNNLGNVSYVQAKYEKAFSYHSQALKMREKRGDRKGVSSSYNNIGLLYEAQGNYEIALDYYLKSVKIKEELGDKPGLGATLDNIGVVYEYLGNNEKALEYHLQALNIQEELGNKENIAGSLFGVGNIYFAQKDHKNALGYYTKSLWINEEIGNMLGIANCWSNIASTYHRLYPEKTDSILFYNFNALKIREEINDKNGMIVSMLNISSIYMNLNKIYLAQNYINKSLSLAKEIGDLYETGQSYFHLTRFYEHFKNYQKAYDYHLLYTQIKDSLFNEESSKQITEMQTKYETEKKEQQIKLLNKDKEIQTKDLQRQKTIRNAVAGGLMLVLLFSFVLINRLLLIRKQKKLIEIEREKSEKLLLNILPKETADELKHKNIVTPKHYDMVTVMFTDFKGFTTIAEKMSAEELVSELDFIFKKFDEIISKYPIEKIKTIGDAYMCAGGLPVANTTNPIDVVNAALEIQGWMKSQNKWQLRLGIHTGSVIAGVVGDKKFAYDIWGDTVNTASRMESSGEAGKVNISGSTYNLLLYSERSEESFKFTFRGKIPAKNKGEIEMYFVDPK